MTYLKPTRGIPFGWLFRSICWGFHQLASLTEEVSEKLWEARLWIYNHTEGRTIWKCHDCGKQFNFTSEHRSTVGTWDGGIAAFCSKCEMKRWKENE